MNSQGYPSFDTFCVMQKIIELKILFLFRKEEEFENQLVTNAHSK